MTRIATHGSGSGIVTSRYGAVPEPVAVMLHHRPVFWAYALWELGNEKAMRRLPASLRELVVYRVATQVGCSWCVDFGTMLLRHHGLDIERLREFDSYQTSSAFTPTERRALAYADAMTALPTTVTDGMVTELDADLGHDGLVELTYADRSGKPPGPVQSCPGYHRPGVHLRRGVPPAASRLVSGVTC